MHFLSLTTLALAVGSAIAGPTPKGLVRHEKRGHQPHVVRKTRAPRDITLPVRIGLTQSNLDIGHETLMEISNPFSEKYGQHLTPQEIGEMFRPSRESVDSVRDWLHNAGIDIERHAVSAGRGWLKFEATTEELEALLATEYHVYHNTKTKDEHVGCNEYHIPEHLVGSIDFITPTVFDTKAIMKDLKKKKRGEFKSFSPAKLNPIVKPATGVFTPGNAHSFDEIPCSTAVTPECLRQLYNIPFGQTATAGNEIGIFEDGDFYDQDDLDLTFAAVAPYVPNGTHPTLNGIDGGVAPLFYDGYQYIGEESLLDMSIIFPLIHPQQAILYQVDDLKEAELSRGFGDTFLDALDASYCTFEGGDDPTLDPHYPDNAPNPPNETYYPNGTWGQSEQCGAYTPTNVISVSYGLGENTFSYHYQNRQCQEYMKLGLQGVSVIYSSGDSGVSNRDACIYPAGLTNYTELGEYPGAFSPSFPASCPYLTSVGATQIQPGNELTEVAVAVPNYDYYSGGGFSNYWPQQSWQFEAIYKYFATTGPQYGNTVYGTPFYNISGRGYPDVAAVGLDILLYYGGQPAFVGGTSASAPIFASIITLINEERLAAGKSRVGFLNPTLYANPGAFNDITSGSNPGCNTDGFTAAVGWDPVTGLGTPNFPALLKVFMDLP